MHDLLRTELLGLARRDGCWGYRRGGSPAAEPTALAALALAARDRWDRSARAAGAWLARGQQTDGSIGVSSRLSAPGWATPLAVLVWSTVGGHDAACARALAWLLADRGKTVPARADRLVGHDPSIAGWSWRPETHPWVEPTAMAILALRRCGLGSHQRVREGVRLLCDRALAAGGWNYGNRTVFGQPLRPHPGPTGLALLALAGRAGAEAVAAPAVAVLRGLLPQTRAGVSLGWGLLGLAAWNQTPPESSRWIDAGVRHALRSPDSTLPLALLLLAATPHGAGLFSP